ncbi:hypothetical protein ELH06_12570 [Rhizobium ruizarguesonis]|uniref:hypothetical protein n=1 Tax=Rhizobium ruizarguesonis TaxID=2081791 RepID=UPI00102F2F98|nr:hypothetical protein [Rhizobium ruizarguesonis]TBE49935.1 hypothetical protein ELH06_12570 [Rhizobium ruizarguesonis]
MSHVASYDDHIAFVAIQASLSTEGTQPTSFQVVAVGTKSGKPHEWRCCRLPLDDFLRRSLQGEPVFEDGSLTGGIPCEAAGGPKDDTALEKQPGRLAFSNIVLAAFYTFDQDFEPKQGPRPLARLDTLGFVYKSGKLSLGFPAEASGRSVSTLYVVPDPSRHGIITSFSLRTQIKAGMNGHLVVSGDERGDRFDSRILFNVFATQDDKAPRSLWAEKSVADPDPTDDPWFDGMALKATTRGWIDDASSRAVLSQGKGRLSQFGYGTIQGTVTHIPVWQDAKLEQPGRRAIWRVWGFRVGKYRDDSPATPQRLILRFEMQPVRYPVAHQDGFSDAIDTLLKGRVPDPEIGVTLRPPYFSQEQRLGDIGAPLAPCQSVRWIIAARLQDASRDATSLAKRLLAGLPVAEGEIKLSLRKVADGSGLSAIPALDDWKQPAGYDLPWHVVGQLQENRAWQRAIVDAKATLQYDKSRSVVWTVVEPRMRKDYWHDDKTKSLSINARAKFMAIRSTSGVELADGIRIGITAPERALFDAPDTPKCTQWPAYQPAVSSLDAFENVDGGVRFGVRIEEMAETDVLIGAFRLKLQGESTTVDVGEQMCLIRQYGGPASTRLSQGVELSLKLPVTDLYPEGQDSPSGARGAAARDPTRPLLADDVLPDPSEAIFFPLFSDDKTVRTGAQTRYELVLRETAGRGRDHEVRLKLRSVADKDTERGPGIVVVVDPQPFRVIGVQYVDPRSSATDTSNEVAVWNAGGEGGLSWRIRDDKQAVQLLLPPQVIGEAMEKNRADDTTLPPDIIPDRPAAARFGGATIIEVDPTYADTNYREPGWNLRRILGFPGQRAPGARLRRLRAELAYGLTTQLEPASETWITEIGSTLGIPPTKFTQVAGRDDAKHPFIELANAVIDAQSNRLAVEKLWSGQPDRPLRIERGLSFALRHRRRGEDGLLQPGGPATPFRWPVPNEIPPDLPLSPSQRNIIDNTFSVARSDGVSFPGGVSWAFESANILGEVYRNPFSETGRIDDVHLSALGAWAGQRAAFAEEKSMIDTEITLGRLQRYRLERIGRVGALWHRAKHVIVYERTVVPSRQFYNRYPIGVQQDALLGRPVLRKVEEYVELLQPVRRYPENGTSISATGFMVGAEFKSKRIAVNSKWGGDVRREGWSVPLWNPSFEATGVTSPNNPDDPSLIYPKPQIRCIFAAADGGETSVEIDEPQKLVFYTSTLPGDRGDDTDGWKAVRDVDFVDLPLPVAGRLEPSGERLTDAMLPPEPAHVPGFERLTLALKVTEETVALMHGRAQTGPGAMLRNVTIARAVESTQPALAETRGAVEKLTTFAADLRAKMDDAVGRSLSVLETLDPAFNLGTSHRDKIGEAVVAALKPITGLGDLQDSVPDVGKMLAEKVAGGNSGGASAASALALKERVSRDAVSEIARLASGARALVDRATSGVRQPLVAATGAAAVVNTVITALRINGTGEYREIGEDDRIALTDALRGVHDNLWEATEDLKADISEIAKDLILDLNTIAKAAGGDIRAQGIELSLKLADFVRSAESLLDAIGKAAGGVADDTVVSAAKAFSEHLVAFRGQVAILRRKIESGTNASALRAVMTICGIVETGADLAAAYVDDIQKNGDAISPQITRILTPAKDYGNALYGGLNALVGAIGANISAEMKALQNSVAILVAKTVAQLNDGCDAASDLLTDHNMVIAPIIGTVVALSGQVDDGDFTAWAQDVLLAADNLATAIRSVITKLDQQFQAARDLALGVIDQAEATAAALVETAIKTIVDAATSLDGMLTGILEGDFKQRVAEAFGLDQATAIAKRIEKAINKALDDAVLEAGAYSRRFLEDAKARIYGEAAQATREIEQHGRQLLGSLQSSVADTLGTDPVALGENATRLAQEGSDVLRLIRAVGDPPKSDRLGMNRPEVAYILKEVDKVINITPAVSLVNRVSDTLSAVDQAGKAIGDLIPSMGFRVPASQFAEYLVPEKLAGLPAKLFMPTIAGLDLRGMLSRAGLPDLEGSEAVKITQGFDKTERRLWMKAVVDIPFSETVDVLTFGPVTLAVDSARFYAESQMSTGLDGSAQRINGSITGDWRVVCSGQDIVTFRRTALEFDESGRIDFKIAPERVALADALEFLTNFLAVSGKGQGLVVEPLMRGSVPAGIAATLDLALPDMSLGAFSITGLSLHVLFGVAAIPEFEMMGELSLAQRTSPFTLSVWILNGGGYLTQRMSFRPTARPRPILMYTLDVGIVAGVGLGFSFGVVSGGVWLQVGCSIAITWTTQNGGNSTALSVFILARGNVDIAGLVTANIMLLMEVSYDGARMIGRGTLRLSFKISMFYTLRVNQGVEYTFIGEKKPTPDQDYAGAFA